MSHKPKVFAKRRIDYRALFDGDTALAHELEDLLAVHPAPDAYRERLRRQLLAAASDEHFYRRAVSRRVLVAASVVAPVLLSVVGLIAWRTLDQRARRVVVAS